MKATGIVRRIDELGRVVIPKEIRRTQRIISQPLEKLMDGRRLYQSEGIAEKCILPCEGSPRAVLCAAPIIAAGDVTGVVALLTEDRTATPDAAQLKAVNVAAAFLARQMEE